MSDNVIATTSEEVLKKYLAPDVAKAAAAEIASGVSGSLGTSIQVAISAALAGASASAPAAPAAAPKPKGRGKSQSKAPATAKPAAAAGTGRQLSPQARAKMRFKKKLHWALSRQKSGEEPHAGDAEVIAAAAQGKMISIDRFTKKPGKKKTSAAKTAAKPAKGKKAAVKAKSRGKKASVTALPTSVPAAKAANGTHGKTTVSEALPV